MMINLHTIKSFDGDDEIVFSHSFNLYENCLKIEGIFGLNITFNFDEEGAEKRDKDIDISGEDNNAIVHFSSKIRNTLGSGTTGKVEIAETNIADERFKIYFSLYVSKIGDKSSGLNVNITFYRRKI